MISNQKKLFVRVGSTYISLVPFSNHQDILDRFIFLAERFYSGGCSYYNFGTLISRIFLIDYSAAVDLFYNHFGHACDYMLEYTKEEFSNELLRILTDEYLLSPRES